MAYKGRRGGQGRSQGGAADRLRRIDEYHRQVTGRLIEQIEKGTAPWTQAWAPGEQSLPANVQTGKAYRGGNSVWLMSVAEQRGYGDHRWGTYNQVEGLGGQVQRKRLSQLKPFFSYAKSEGWISTSPVDGIRSPKPDSRPTMPLSVDEMRALLAASNGKPKEQALLLLLRHSGLAITDAATLARSSLHAEGELILRRSKSGELVTLQLPVEALAGLEAIAQPARPHYFWTGTSAPATVARYWRNRLQMVAATAGVEGVLPHRLRDTFAVELLLAGVAMHDVSALLGHSSVQTTEKYYAPWNTARRYRLNSLLRDVHQQDLLLLGFIPKKPAGGSLATRVKPTRYQLDSIFCG